MAAVMTRYGIMFELSSFLGDLISIDIEVGLYKTDVSLTDETEFTDLTEADFGGYARQDVTTFDTVSWQTAGAYSESPDHTFERDNTAGDNTIYGYFVVVKTTEELLWAQAAGTPVVMEFDGDQIIVKLKAYVTN